MASPSYSTVKLSYASEPAAGPIPALVHYSATPSATPRPVALAFHAGGFVGGSAGMVPAAQVAVLVRAGFVVVAAEYRLCPQVGLYEGPVTDAKASLRWCQRVLPGLLPAHAAGVLVDGARVVVFGHSAGGSLALHVASEPNGPLAVLDFYGSKHYDAGFWRQPLPAFAQIPKLDQAFLDKVFDGPVPTSSPPMFTPEGKPDLASPRNAWMISTLRDGDNLDKVIGDGGVARADPLTYFHRKFPPAMFIHGTADVFAPKSASGIACMKLRKLGVEAELVSVEGAAHVFDFPLKENDELFQGPVMKGLNFLISKAGL